MKDQVLATKKETWPRWFSMDELQSKLEEALGMSLQRTHCYTSEDGSGSCKLTNSSGLKSLFTVECGRNRKQGWFFTWIRTSVPACVELQELHLEKVRVETIRRGGKKLKISYGEDGAVKQEVVLSKD